MTNSEPAAVRDAGGPLHVAVDATPLLSPLTGVGVFCRGALQGLVQRDDVVVSAFAVSWRRRGLLADRLPQGVAWHQRAMPARPLHLAWDHGRVPPIEWFIGPCDVVHGTNYVVPPARRAARVVTVHDLTVLRFPEMCDEASLGYPRSVRRAIATGAWVHTHSEFVAAEVVEVLGCDPERVRAVPPGVPDAAVLSAEDSLGPSAAPNLPAGTGSYILAIGTVEPRKDYGTLLKAFTSVAACIPDVALVIAGADGWGAEAFAEVLAGLPAEVRLRVVRPGYLDSAQLRVLLLGAAVLAYPSLYEGFGLPPLEAMAAGVPVVTTRAGSIPEVVGDAAVLVEPGDAEALAGALLEVLGGAGVENMIRRGRTRAEQFSWERCAAGLAGLYRDAYASR